MTVAELLSVLEEMTPTDEVVIGLLMKHNADTEFIPTGNGGVYKAVVTLNGVDTNSVVIEAGDDRVEMQRGFTNGTWAQYCGSCGYATAASAPASVQTAVFYADFNSHGFSDWTCPGV